MEFPPRSFRLGHAAQRLRKLTERQRVWAFRTSGEATGFIVPKSSGYPTGHRPYVDRTYRPSTECCRLHGHPRAIRPGHRAGIFQSIVYWSLRKHRGMIPQLKTDRKLSIPWGLEREEATARLCLMRTSHPE